MKVIVLSGGTSSEREVSLRTGATVAKALKEAGHSVRIVDSAKPLTKEQLDCDVVFPALHGKGGEDGLIQKQLNEFGIQYVGSDVTASELCFDKQRYKEFLIANDLRVPRGGLVTEQQFWDSELTSSGFVLKPFDGGSSIDTILHRIGDSPPTKEEINDIFTRHDTMLLEQLIEGTEITAAVFNDQAMPIIEIIPPKQGWFDYENKYNGLTNELCPAVNISTEVQAKAQALALQIHKLCDCRDMSRTDMIVDKNEQLWVLETNTIPGMTDESLLPVAIATQGMTYSEMVDQLVRAAAKH